MGSASKVRKYNRVKATLCFVQRITLGALCLLLLGRGLYYRVFRDWEFFSGAQARTIGVGECFGFLGSS